MYICVCLIQNVSRIQYSTWCQNRGYICISSIRTYRIESILHTTILQDRILPKLMGRGPKRDTSQSSNSTRVTTQILHKESNRFPVIPCYSVGVSIRNPVSLSTGQNFHSNTKKILQLQGSFHAYTYNGPSSSCVLWIPSY